MNKFLPHTSPLITRPYPSLRSVIHCRFLLVNSIHSSPWMPNGFHWFQNMSRCPLLGWFLYEKASQRETILGRNLCTFPLILKLNKWTLISCITLYKCVLCTALTVLANPSQYQSPSVKFELSDGLSAEHLQQKAMILCNQPTLGTADTTFRQTLCCKN